MTPTSDLAWACQVVLPERATECIMGFLTGRVGYVRFRVDGASPGSFGPEHLEKLSSTPSARQREERKDGTEAGWIAGDDILDLGFDLAKNVVDDCLLFSLRLDVRKLPADLLRAYAREELQALAADNPSGRPSARQKKEAREAAQQRLEAEAKDGRFTRRKAYPLLWDGRSNHLLIGTTSAGVLDHALRLFQETFGCPLEQADAGRRALLGRAGRCGPPPLGVRALGCPRRGGLGDRRRQPGPPRQRVPALAVVRAGVRGGYSLARRRLGGRRDDGEDAAAGVPQGRLRQRDHPQCRPREAARGPPGGPGGQAAAPGRLDTSCGTPRSTS